MSQLCLYLPPFSSDYSGVCSSLFELNGMVIIQDGFCCTRNYTSFDEPRWFGHRRPIYCSGLREIDAVMGDDEKLLRKIRNTYQSLTEKPDFIALLTSPVPTLIGSDVDGISNVLESEFGIPAFGFTTTGMHYYNEGVGMAMLTLTKEFTEEPNGPRKGANLLGLTPLDYSDNSNAKDLAKLLEDNGIPIVCSDLMNVTVADIKRAANAAVNVVVSQSGMMLAKYMKERWGIPYVVGTAMGTDNVSFIDMIKQNVHDGKDRIQNPHVTGESKTLIIGDQVIANSIRYKLINDGSLENATVASFFDLDKEATLAGDFHINDEYSLSQVLGSGRYDTIIADPLVKTIPEAEGKTFIEVPHVAVSSKIYWHNYSVFQSKDTDERLNSAKHYI